MDTGRFVVFDHVQKTYDGQNLVVSDLNLDIAKGEFLTMLGPSGSGKTTCLMMLAGFETATSGEILLAGRPINLVPPHKRGIGMVFQSYALFPHMTVGENLAFPLEVRGVGKAEREAKIGKALDMVQMGAFAYRRPAQLSGGQQQRIALARALVFEPELVLMDEPLGALDKQLREHMQFEIKHLNAGRIQQLAPPTELYESPINSFVAGFIGENNRLPGVVESISGDTAQVRLGDGSVIPAVAINVDRVGQKTQVSIRPERVEILTGAQSNKGPLGPGVEAEVLEFIYMGDVLRTRLCVAGSNDFVVKTRNTLSRSQHRPERGEKIRIGWLQEDARALDLETGSN
jgi:putative spermidine/putrescine transport system ATP-binding protein